MSAEKENVEYRTPDVNVAIAVSRKFLLTEIPLLNDLAKTLQEVISDMPSLDARGAVAEFSIGNFCLDSVDHDKTGLEFAPPKKNGFCMVAKFYGVMITAEKTEIGFRKEIMHPGKVPLIDIAVRIPVLEIAINFMLVSGNEIRFFVYENDIKLPSVQVSAKRSVLGLAAKGVHKVLPKVAQVIDKTDEVCREVVDKMNPWFEIKFIKSLCQAINAESCNIIPEGTDKVSVELEEGTISSSLKFVNITLDDKNLWIKGQCCWSAQAPGKPDFCPPPAQSPHRIVNEAEQEESTDVSAFVDSALVNQFFEAVWYVMPTATTLTSQEVHLGSALVNLLKHLPGWKAKKEKFVAHLNHTCEPPTLRARDNTGLKTDIRVTTTLTADTADAGAGPTTIGLVDYFLAVMAMPFLAVFRAPVFFAAMRTVIQKTRDKDVIKKGGDTGLKAWISAFLYCSFAVFGMVIFSLILVPVVTMTEERTKNAGVAKQKDDEEKTHVTVLQANIEATTEIYGPTFDADKGTFDFDLRGLTINNICISDYRDSGLSKRLTKFLEHALVHRHGREKSFSGWWEREGGLIDKCRHAMGAFNEHLKDSLRHKVDAAVKEGLQEVNDMIDTDISQFVLPTGDFEILGHKIHLEAQEILANMDDDVIKMMTDVVIDDKKVTS